MHSLAAEKEQLLQQEQEAIVANNAGLERLRSIRRRIAEIDRVALAEGEAE